MSCDGAVETISGGGVAGNVIRLTCCPPPPANEQELVRRWRQVSGDRFNTYPMPYGVATFNNMFVQVGIAGPPDPGSYMVASPGPDIIPPMGPARVTSTPNNTPVPPDINED